MSVRLLWMTVFTNNMVQIYPTRRTSCFIHVKTFHIYRIAGALIFSVVGGDDVKEAFEQVIVCMFGYMTDLKTVDMIATREMEAEGGYIDQCFAHIWLISVCFVQGTTCARCCSILWTNFFSFSHLNTSPADK